MRTTILVLWTTFLALSLITQCSVLVSAEVSVHHKGNTTKPSCPDKSIHKHGQDHKVDHTHAKKQHVEKLPKSPPKSSNTTKSRPRSFRNSIYRYMDKIYIGRDDWYSAYRRNRGPNGVMRKLVLESNRRKKASITFPPIPPELEGQDTMGSSGHNIDVGNDTTDDYASMVPRFGRESVTDSDPSSSFSGPNSKIRGVTGSNGDKDDEDDEDDDEDDDDEEEDQQESIQGVRKHSVVAVPVPVIVRPVGLIPKSRSGGNRSYGLPAGDGPNRVQLLVLQGIWMVSVVLVVDGFLR